MVQDRSQGVNGVSLSVIMSSQGNDMSDCECMYLVADT